MSVLWWITILLSCTVFYMLIRLTIGFIRGRSEKLAELSKVLWPRRWLLFVYLPFGGKILDIVQKNISRPYSLKFSSIRESETNLLSFNPNEADWLLFEEQYDRKTSAHHGTKISVLNKKRNYRFVTSILLPVLQENADGVIYIETPRPMNRISSQLFIQDVIPWANLLRESEEASWWILQNTYSGTIIPVYHVYPKGSEGFVINSEEQSKPVKSMDKFCVGLSEFQIINLPKLAVFFVQYPIEDPIRLTDNYTNSKLLKGRISFGAGLHNYFKAPQNDDKIQNTHWEIIDGELIVMHNGYLEYTSIASGLPSDFGPRSRIFINPGDRFRIVTNSIEYRFWIDYLRE